MRWNGFLFLGMMVGPLSMVNPFQLVLFQS